MSAGWGTYSAPPTSKSLSWFKGPLRRRMMMEGRSSGWKGRTRLYSEGEEGQRGRRRKMREQEREKGE